MGYLPDGSSRITFRYIRSIGVWRSPVARFVRDEEVVGSNPATPTYYFIAFSIELPL